MGYLKDDQRPRVYGRVIDFDVESGDEESAKKLFRQAAEKNVVPAVNSPQGRRLAEVVAAERRQAEQKEKQSARPKVGKRQVFAREEDFRRLVLDKTADEVVMEVGRPDHVHPGGRFTNGTNFDESWVYEKTVEHRATGKKLGVKVFFKGGKVIETSVHGGWTYEGPGSPLPTFALDNRV